MGGGGGGGDNLSHHHTPGHVSPHHVGGGSSIKSAPGCQNKSGVGGGALGSKHRRGQRAGGPSPLVLHDTNHAHNIGQVRSQYRSGRRNFLSLLVRGKYVLKLYRGL